MDEFEYDLTNTLTKELKQGGSIGSLVGKLVSKIGPLFIKHAPKILPGLALAGASDAISGATHKAVAGKGIGIYHDYGLMLTDSQKKRLQTAKDGITLRLTNDQLSGDDRLLLTKSPINKIEKFNNGTKYILTVIDVFSKYAWAVPLPSKEGKHVAEALRTIMKRRTPRLLWVDKGTEFYNRTFQKFLREHDIEMYSTNNEGKAVVVERFNRTLKNWMWKYFSEHNTSKYIDVLDDLLESYNNRKHRTVKMTPTQASQKSNEARVYENTYGDKKLMSDVGTAKFHVGDKVRIVKLKRHFEKGYTPNFTEEIFEVDNIHPTNPLTYSIKDLADDPIQGSFYEQELQATSQDKFRIEKVIRRVSKALKMQGNKPSQCREQTLTMQGNKPSQCRVTNPHNAG